jgi:cytochrome P450
MHIDLLSPASFIGGQPHDQFRWLRENDPVHWHEEPGGRGYWAVTRYEDVWTVDRDFQTYSSEPTIMIADPAAGQPGGGGIGPYKMMLMMDPPEHAGFRKLIRQEFTLPSTRLRGERIAALARQIVDAVAAKGECDFVADIAGEMPSFVIAELMGLPLDDGRELYKLTETIHTAPEALPPGAGGQAVAKMFEYGSGVIAAKRAKPGDDLASKLLAAEMDGRRLEDIEFLLFFLLLVDAGGDTTRNLLSGGLLALMQRPDQLAWLTQDLDARLPAARDELLRWTSPVVYMRRTARHDAELNGAKIKAGDKVVMYFGAANRDPARFDHPDTLDLARPMEDGHLAFGAGPHVCLGQHIAKIEIDAMLREVLTRLDGFELASEPEWLPSNFISGPKSMPIRYRAAG